MFVSSRFLARLRFVVPSFAEASLLSGRLDDPAPSSASFLDVTQAEWEFACRAVTTTNFWSGDTDKDLLLAGWVGANSRGRTQAVGELKANPFGLYEVHGNVIEWANPRSGTSESWNWPGAVMKYEEGQRFIRPIPKWLTPEYSCGYRKNRPPLISSTAPLMNRAASLTKNRTASATSSAVPLRPSGVSRRYCSIRSGDEKTS